MKVNGENIIPYKPVTPKARVQEKTDHQSFDQALDQEKRRQKRDDDHEDEADRDQKVHAAVDQFEREGNLADLHAESVGAGPGLKVILKDKKGSTVRELSGAEFLELRDRVSKGMASSGKILDRKA